MKIGEYEIMKTKIITLISENTNLNYVEAANLADKVIEVRLGFSLEELDIIRFSLNSVYIDSCMEANRERKSLIREKSKSVYEKVKRIIIDLE